MKEISKEQQSLKVVFFTMIFKPKLKNQSIFTDFKKYPYLNYVFARQKYDHFHETKLKRIWNEFENNFRNSTTFTFLKSASTNLKLLNKSEQ